MLDTSTMYTSVRRIRPGFTLLRAQSCLIHTQVLNIVYIVKLVEHQTCDRSMSRRFESHPACTVACTVLLANREGTRAPAPLRLSK